MISPLFIYENLGFFDILSLGLPLTDGKDILIGINSHICLSNQEESGLGP